MARVVEHSHHDDGGCGVIRATCLSPSCARGNRARGAATVGSGARYTSARVRAPVKGPLTSCERRSDKSQLAAYLTHVRKSSPAKSRLRSHQAAPAESRLRSHQACSGGKLTPVAPSPLRRKAHSGRTKPTLVALSGGKPTPVAPRLYISVSPTLRGPAGNKKFSFVTR